MIKEKILKALKENPGCRARTLAWLIQEKNYFTLLDALVELEKEEKVYCKAHHDLANMESYNMWYVKGE